MWRTGRLVRSHYSHRTAKSTRNVDSCFEVESQVITVAVEYPGRPVDSECPLSRSYFCVSGQASSGRRQIVVTKHPIETV
jgi:hypothetical protein